MVEAAKAPTRRQAYKAFKAAVAAMDVPKALKKQVRRLARLNARMARIADMADRAGADKDALAEELEARQAEAHYIKLKLKMAAKDYPELASLIK